MKKMLFLCCSLYFGGLCAQDLPLTEVASKIERVTVFIRGAQVHRTATAQAPAGISHLVFRNLSPLLDPTSIQLEMVSGEVTVLSVNHRVNFLSEPDQSKELSDLENRIKTLDDSIALTKALIATLADQESFLKANQSVGGQQTGLKLEELRAVAAFYGDQLRSIKREQLALDKALKAFAEERNRYSQQLKELQSDLLLNSSEVVVRVRVDQPQRVAMSLSYLCSNAGWFPAYDLRARDVGAPIDLTYKAKVYQNTGEDWQEVNMSFSNADPTLSGKMPALAPYRLTENPVIAQPDYGVPDAGIRQVRGRVVDAYGEPLIGASILVRGTTVGAITDFDGKFSIMLPEGANVLNFSYVGYASKEVPVTQPTMEIALEENISLEEVVVTGLAGRTAGVSTGPERIQEQKKQLPTTPVEYQTTVAFELDIPFSVPSDGEQYTLELGRFQVPAIFEYQATPKLEAAAFLTARVTDWEKLNILAGEASLFFEDTYLGQTLLDLRNIADTLTLSLGRDRSILIDRQPVEEYRRSNFAGNKRVESRTFRLLARNSKSQPVSLLIRDQIPVSTSKEIEVTPEDLAGGRLDQETGEITWTMPLAPGEQREWRFSYRVRCPADLRLRLE